MIGWSRGFPSWAAALLAGIAIGVVATVGVMKPWSDPVAVGRAILARPMRWEAPPRIPITLPDAPDVEKRLEPGPTTTVTTLQPKTEKDRKALEQEFSINLRDRLVLALKDDGEGRILAHTPVDGGPVDLTRVKRPESWREWKPEWTFGAFAARELTEGSEWGPLVMGGWSPGRVWNIRPVFGGMLGSNICSRGCVLAGGVATFE